MKGFALFLAQSFILFLAIKIISKGYSFKTTNIHQENKAINHTNDTFVRFVEIAINAFGCPNTTNKLQIAIMLTITLASS